MSSFAAPPAVTSHVPVTTGGSCSHVTSVDRRCVGQPAVDRGIRGRRVVVTAADDREAQDRDERDSEVTAHEGADPSTQLRGSDGKRRDRRPHGTL